MAQQSSNDKRMKRHRRVRRKIQGTAERPRLNVFRSSKHIQAQLIDDVQGTTLVTASSLTKDLRGSLKSGGSVVAAKTVGKALAQLAKQKGIEKAVFDRGGYLYHGRVKALAEGAREGGLAF